MNIFILSAILFDVIIKIALHISRWSVWRQFINFKVRNFFLIAQSRIKIFSFSRTLRWGRENCILHDQRSNLRHVCFFWRRKPVLSFLDLYQKNLDFIVNTHQQRCKIYLLRVQKNKPNKFLLFITFFHQKRGIWASENWPFGGSFSGRSLKLSCCVPENYFDGKHCFDKRTSFQAIPESEREPVSLSGIFSTCSSKLYSTSRKDHSEECV